MKAIALLFMYVAMVCSATSAMAQEPPEREPTEEEVAEAMPPLMRAAWKGQVDEVRKLLKEGADVNETIGLGFTALIVASGHGHLDVIKVLLDAGADPNGVRSLLSPLIAATNRRNKKRLETIDMLIAAGAKVNPPLPSRRPSTMP